MTELDARDALLLTLARICMATGTQAGANTDRLFTQIVAFEAVAEIERQRENERRWHVQIAENAGLRGDVARLRAALAALVQDVSDADARQPFVDAVAALAALAPTQEPPK
jgi:hypothetical protein